MRLVPASDPAWQIAADRALYWLEPRLPAVIAGTVVSGVTLILAGYLLRTPSKETADATL